MNPPEEVLDIARVVATDVIRQTGEYVHHWDLMWAADDWAERNPYRLSVIMELDDRERRDAIKSALWHRFRRIAAKARANHHGYLFHDIVWYDEEAIRLLLESYYDDSAWVSPPQSDGQQPSSNRGNLAERGNWVAGLCDLGAAVKKLDAETRRLLRYKYEEDLPQKEIAVRLGWTDSQVSERLSRAPRKIQGFLGGPRPIFTRDEITGPLARPVVAVPADAEPIEDVA